MSFEDTGSTSNNRLNLSSPDEDSDRVKTSRKHARTEYTSRKHYEQNYSNDKYSPKGRYYKEKCYDKNYSLNKRPFVESTISNSYRSSGFKKRHEGSSRRRKSSSSRTFKEERMSNEHDHLEQAQYLKKMKNDTLNAYSDEEFGGLVAKRDEDDDDNKNIEPMETVQDDKLFNCDKQSPNYPTTTASSPVNPTKIAERIGRRILQQKTYHLKEVCSKQASISISQQFENDMDLNEEDLDDIHNYKGENEDEKRHGNELVNIDDLPPYYPAISGCRSVTEFRLLNHVQEGTYGVVYRAIDKQLKEIVAMKRLKMEREKEGFPITSLREINTLLKGQHPNVVTVREIVMGNSLDKVYIVMDFIEHDLKSLIENMRSRKQIFTISEVKYLLKQLLCAVAYLHDNWILHRDLKTSNLLLSSKGVLKVGDFGLAREYGSPLMSYTPIVVTLWYRAPELLLGAKQYSTHIDIWSVACIFGELLLMKPVFPGKSEIEQLTRIFKLLGTPSEKMWPGYSKLPGVQKMKLPQYPSSNLRSRFHILSVTGHDLLWKLFIYDPAQRMTAEKAVDHQYFTETPLAIDPDRFATWSTNTDVVKQEIPSEENKSGQFSKDANGDKVPDNDGFTLRF